MNNPDVRVGGPDPTGNSPSERYCFAHSPEDFVCTLPKGHGGSHVAGDEEIVCAVWPQGGDNA